MMIGFPSASRPERPSPGTAWFGKGKDEVISRVFEVGEESPSREPVQALFGDSLQCLTIFKTEGRGGGDKRRRRTG